LCTGTIHDMLRHLYDSTLCTLHIVADRQVYVAAVHFSSNQNLQLQELGAHVIAKQTDDTLKLLMLKYVVDFTSVHVAL